MHTEVVPDKFVWKKKFMKSSSNRLIYHEMCVTFKSRDTTLTVSWSSCAQLIWVKIFSRKALTI